MDAYGRVDCRVTPSQFHHPFARIGRNAGADDRPHAGFLGASDHRAEIAVELFVVEMGVGVDVGHGGLSAVSFQQ